MKLIFLGAAHEVTGSCTPPAAGKRLRQVIEQCKGLSNKELARFIDQINTLWDKYVRK